MRIDYDLISPCNVSITIRADNEHLILNDCSRYHYKLSDSSLRGG